jgi:cell fate (sporulation/competence/biofilm development) regulator YmcA (YheA/YmcA/DUF963 family)
MHFLHLIKIFLLNLEKFCLINIHLMPNAKKLTSEQLDKIINCQSTLKSSFDVFTKATDKLNALSIGLEQKMSAIPKYQTNTAFYKNNQNKKALQYANAEIDKITRQFLNNIKSIEQNIGVFDSQEIYLKRIQELVEYYKKNISADKLKIANDRSKISIANRLSTFYTENEGTAKTVNKYTLYVYWSIFAVVSVILTYNIIMGGTLNSIYEKSVALIVRTISTDEEKSKGGGKSRRRIKGGGKSRSHMKGGENSHSLRLWIIILSVFLIGYFIIVPFIIKPLSSYIAKYGLQIILAIVLISVAGFSIYKYFTNPSDNTSTPVSTATISTNTAPVVSPAPAVTAPAVTAPAVTAAPVTAAPVPAVAAPVAAPVPPVTAAPVSVNI